MASSPSAHPVHPALPGMPSLADGESAFAGAVPARVAAQPRRRRRLALLGGVALLVLGAAAWGGWTWWTTWRFRESTDDAYVQADVVTIAPEVAGDIVGVAVADNQAVKAGDLLATIDPRPYQAAVDQAAAAVGEAQAAIDTLGAQRDEQQAIIDEAQATIAVDQASQTFAEQNSRRFGTLAHDGFGSVQNAQLTESQTVIAGATVDKDRSTLVAAQRQIAVIDAQLEAAKATLARNRAMLDQARLSLGYTTLRSPVDGVVGERTLRVGQYVEPGTQLLAVVPLGATYVVANFKETQLDAVRPGQSATIEVDTFPGVAVRGVVDSVAPASGQEFALLPPDNATGNFTKIVQRVPVRIDLAAGNPLAGALRPGMSVTATIDTAPPAIPSDASVAGGAAGDAGAVR